MELVQTEPFIINQDSLEQQFKDHLVDTTNHRILFSGPFGQGKTTFLNKVFQDEEAEYLIIKLYPVNYSVSSNEDVFQLIKFDILTQLIGMYGSQLDLQQEDFSKLLTAQVFVRDSMSLTPWIEAILSCFGSIGKSSSDFFKAFRDTVENFDEFHKSIQLDETKDIQAFVNGLIEKEGSAYEMDTVSEKIKELIKRLRKNSNHKVVLVIDDLDRLDPDHIFRLFNVFSTQFEYRGESLYGNGYNKFGFDKIIFVCDIENIRRIYRHKYGAGVDFKGYLDKFYSHAPFDFDNREFVRNRIQDIFEALRVLDSSVSARRYDELMVNNRTVTSFMSVTESLFINLINSRLLNLRTLVNVKEITLKDIPINIGRSGLDSSSYNIIILFQILLTYYPSVDVLNEKLQELINMFDENRDHSRGHGPSDNSWRFDYMISICIPFLVDLKTTLVYRWLDGNPDILYSPVLNCYLHFSVNNDWYGRGFEFEFKQANIGDKVDSDIVELNPYEVLSKTLLKLKKLGVLE